LLPLVACSSGHQGDRLIGDIHEPELVIEVIDELLSLNGVHPPAMIINQDPARHLRAAWESAAAGLPAQWRTPGRVVLASGDHAAINTSVTVRIDRNAKIASSLPAGRVYGVSGNHEIAHLPYPLSPHRLREFAALLDSDASLMEQATQTEIALRELITGRFAGPCRPDAGAGIQRRYALFPRVCLMCASGRALQAYLHETDLGQSQRCIALPKDYALLIEELSGTPNTEIATFDAAADPFWSLLFKFEVLVSENLPLRWE
jgi:hypothetical protein